MGWLTWMVGSRRHSDKPTALSQLEALGNDDNDTASAFQDLDNNRLGLQPVTTDARDGRGQDGGSALAASKPPSKRALPLKKALRAIDAAISEAAAATPLQHTGSADETPAASCWDATLWLHSIDDGGVLSILVSALLGSADAVPVDRRSWLRALGKQGEQGEAAVHALLCDPVVVRDLAAKVWGGVQALAATDETDEGRHSPTAAQQLQDKFVQKGTTLALDFGSLSTFYAGLEGLVGAPSPQVLTTMRNEHCSASDSELEFTAANFETVTTSKIEWHFVVEPSASALARLGLDTWPAEQSSTTHPSSRRTPTDPSVFNAYLQQTNLRLEELGCELVTQPEIIGARLYTVSATHPPATPRLDAASQQHAAAAAATALSAHSSPLPGDDSPTVHRARST